MDCGFPDILNAFEQALELERELGTRTVDCDRALLVPVRREDRERQEGREQRDHQDHRESQDIKVPKGEMLLPTAEELAACTKCPLATLGRQHVVPGQGNAASPDVMFIGGASEPTALVIKQARELGFQGGFMVMD